MIPANRTSEVVAVDDFLADQGKSLQGESPPWIVGRDGIEWTAIWNIQDSLGVVSAHFRFRLDPQHRSRPSISLIYRSNRVWRVDIESTTVCKPNPLWAASIGAPARVCGSHCHSWPDNRSHILSQELWDIPCRRPIPAQVRRLPQAVSWLAQQVNLVLGFEQRGFDVPPRTSLFESEE
jgi:hypothetical protein